MSNFNSKSISESTPSQDMPEPKYAVGDILELTSHGSSTRYEITEVSESFEYLYKVMSPPTYEKADQELICFRFESELDRHFKKVNYK